MRTLTTSELLDELESEFVSLRAKIRRLEAALQTAKAQIKALGKHAPAKKKKAAPAKGKSRRGKQPVKPPVSAPPKERRVLGMGLAELRKNDGRPATRPTR